MICYNSVAFLVDTLYDLTWGCVPYPAETIVAGADDQRSISVEVNSWDWVTVSWESLQTLASPHIPDTNTLIKTTRHHQVTLKIKQRYQSLLFSHVSPVGWSCSKMHSLSDPSESWDTSLCSAPRSWESCHQMQRPGVASLSSRPRLIFPACDLR